jgi:hypothetical protein
VVGIAWYLHGRVRFVCLLRQHLLDLLVGQENLVDGVADLLDWHVVVVAVGRNKDLGVPDKALTRREVGDLVTDMSLAIRSYSGGGGASVARVGG